MASRPFSHPSSSSSLAPVRKNDGDGDDDDDHDHDHDGREVRRAGGGASADAAEAAEDAGGEAGEGEEQQQQQQQDMPLTMAASVILTNLPTNAKDALKDARVLSGGKEGEERKIVVSFVPLHNAPDLRAALRRSKISAGLPFSRVVKHLRKRLALKETESVFCYLHQCFSPGLDESVGSLFSCFKTGNELIVHYAITPAYG